VAIGLLRGSGHGSDGNELAIRGVSPGTVSQLARSMSNVGLLKTTISARLRLQKITAEEYASYKLRFGISAVEINSEQHFVKLYDIFDGNHRWHALLVHVGLGNFADTMQIQASVYNHSLHNVMAELLGVLHNEIQTVARNASYADTLFYMLKNIIRNREESAVTAPTTGKQSKDKKKIKADKAKKLVSFVEVLHGQFYTTASAKLDKAELLKFETYWTKGYVTGKVFLASWMEGTPLAVLSALTHVIWSEVVEAYKRFPLVSQLVPISASLLSDEENMFPCSPYETEKIHACASSMVSTGMISLLGPSDARKDYVQVADVSAADKLVISNRFLVLHLVFVANKLSYSSASEKYTIKKLDFVKLQLFALFHPQMNGPVRCTLVKQCLEQLESDFDVLGKLYLDCLCNQHKDSGLPTWAELAGLIHDQANVDRDAVEPFTGREYLKNPGLRNLSASIVPGSFELKTWKNLSQRSRVLVLMLMVILVEVEARHKTLTTLITLITLIHVTLTTLNLFFPLAGQSFLCCCYAGSTSCDL
jgi:hypothetical protein